MRASEVRLLLLLSMAANTLACSLEGGRVPCEDGLPPPLAAVRDAARAAGMSDLDLLRCAGRAVTPAFVGPDGRVRQRFDRCEFVLPAGEPDGPDCLRRCEPFFRSTEDLTSARSKVLPSGGHPRFRLASPSMGSRLMTRSARRAVVGMFLTGGSAAAQSDTGAPKVLPLQPLRDDGSSSDARAPAARDSRDEAPRHAFVESPFNLARGTVFAAGTAQVVPTQDKTLTSGGVRVGVSPLDRVSAHVLLGRNAADRWSPSGTLHIRFLGSLESGFALGALASYKAEGFSELGGEAEVGLTAGLRTTHFYLDVNALGGRGLEEEEAGETDGELKARAGYTASSTLRIGVEGQVRKRFAGPRLAPNGRQWDTYAGPQLVAGVGPVVLAATGGMTNATPDGKSGAFALVTVSALQQVWR